MRPQKTTSTTLRTLDLLSLATTRLLQTKLSQQTRPNTKSGPTGTKTCCGSTPQAALIWLTNNILVEWSIQLFHQEEIPGKRKTLTPILTRSMMMPTGEHISKEEPVVSVTKTHLLRRTGYKTVSTSCLTVTKIVRSSALEWPLFQFWTGSHLWSFGLTLFLCLQALGDPWLESHLFTAHLSRASSSSSSSSSRAPSSSAHTPCSAVTHCRKPMAKTFSGPWATTTRLWSVFGQASGSGCSLSSVSDPTTEPEQLQKSIDYNNNDILSLQCEVKGRLWPLWLTLIVARKMLDRYAALDNAALILRVHKKCNWNDNLSTSKLFYIFK